MSSPGELVNDDGALLPPALQRYGAVWQSLFDSLIHPTGVTRGDLLLIDGACIAIAPFWPSGAP